MAQIRSPQYIGRLDKISSNTVQLQASLLHIGSQQYNTAALSLNCGSVGVGGMDVALSAVSQRVYVYAVVSVGTVYLIGSLNASAPTGYTTGTSRYVGEFTTSESNATTIDQTYAPGAFVIPKAGKIEEFAGTTLPYRAKLCDGSQLSQTTFASLFAEIGSSFNTGGETAGNFRIPNKIGRVGIGAGTYTDTVSGSVTRTKGQYLGAERHVMTIPEMPSHTHIQDPHYHRGEWDAFAGSGAPGGGVWSHGRAYSDSNGGADKVIENTTATNQNTGGGGSHNNMQPSVVTGYIIYY